MEDDQPPHRASRKRAPSPEYYTAQEAINILNIPRSTFRYYVDLGLIPRYVPAPKKEGYYPVAFINMLAASLKGKANLPHKRLRALIEQVRASFDRQQPGVSIGATDWIQMSDLPFVLDLDYAVYNPDDVVDPAITRRWWAKNPLMCRILFDASDRRNVWGALTIMPLREETIFRLLRHELTEREITPDDIQVYEPGHVYSGYVASIAIRPAYQSHLRSLVQSMLTYWCEQYPAVQLRRLYAYASTDQGFDLVQGLFFSPRYDLGEDAFELDLLRRNRSRLIRAFQECIRRKQSPDEQPGGTP